MAYSKETWAKARADYESGKVTSVAELKKKYRIATNTIDKRIASENWIKGSKAQELEAKTTNKVMERFAKLGMPPERVAQLMIDGMTLPDILKFEGKGDDMICTPVPDYPTRHKYIQEYNKITGAHEEVKKDTGGGNTLNLVVPIIIPPNARD